MAQAGKSISLEEANKLEANSSKVFKLANSMYELNDLKENLIHLSAQISGTEAELNSTDSKSINERYFNLQEILENGPSWINNEISICHEIINDIRTKLF